MSLREEATEGSPSDAAGDSSEDSTPGSSVAVGTYSWADYFSEFDGDARRVADGRGVAGLGWESTIDPTEVLGFDPDEISSVLTDASATARKLDAVTYDTLDPALTPVRVGAWSWHHFIRAYHDPAYAELDIPEAFSKETWLGFPEEELGNRLGAGDEAAEVLADIVDERTVNVNEELDEDAFFSTVDGETTIVNRYDLEKAVPLEKKSHFREVDRYWVNKPYAFVAIFHSEKENETKYYLIEPYQTPIEANLFEFLTGKLRTSIKYADEVVTSGDEADRRSVIERETRSLLERYGMATSSENSNGGIGASILGLLGREGTDPEPQTAVSGIEARPEPALLAEDATTLSEYQVEKLLYRLTRDFIGYQRIDGVKHDINVEDISCDGYNSPVFVYHTDYEQIISNIHHGEESLDDFVVKLAQRSGKGISKRQPQVDATLPDGSRAQLTLGREVSDHGTNYTIRQFKDVPFTPIDLINWRTFSLEEMAFIWLCIENHKSLIFAGGTASGKTTSLNAVSLFIPSNSKIVSIEDTREVELPQRNWIASVTRPSFSEDSQGDVDEFDLLEAALRQRPEYIVMGEIRGEEGRTLFQVMSTGHTTYTTFHADSVGEVLKRFTTAPINVSKTMFTALDLVSIQTSTRVHGNKVRRNKSLTEINHYDTENDEINVQDVYQWQAETDEFRRMGASNTLDEILFDRGWDRERLEEELFKREIVLAYLIENGLNEYREVAATLQAFINDPDTTFRLIANGTLEDSLEDLREMESVLIDVDPEKEALVPRPDPDDGIRMLTTDILARAADEIFPEYTEDSDSGSIVDALIDAEAADDVTADPGAGADLAEAFADSESAEGVSDDPEPKTDSSEEPVDAHLDEDDAAGPGEGADPADSPVDTGLEAHSDSDRERAPESVTGAADSSSDEQSPTGSRDDGRDSVESMASDGSPSSGRADQSSPAVDRASSSDEPKSDPADTLDPSASRIVSELADSRSHESTISPDDGEPVSTPADSRDGIDDGESDDRSSTLPIDPAPEAGEPDPANTGPDSWEFPFRAEQPEADGNHTDADDEDVIAYERTGEELSQDAARDGGSIASRTDSDESRTADESDPDDGER